MTLTKDNAYLKKNYGAEFCLNWIDQTDPMLNAIEVCNETIGNLLKKKFGKDIFQEARQRSFVEIKVDGDSYTVDGKRIGKEEILSSIQAKTGDDQS